MLTNKCSIFLRCSLLLPVIAFPRFCFSQAPTNEPIRDVEVCQIMSDPGAFDGQRVRFRGRLDFEFEDHAVDDRTCGLPFPHTGVWWTYGGEPLLAHQPEMKKIRAMTSPVLRDAQFDKFQERAHASQKRKPDGETCRSHRQCAFYDVVATYTGRFFAGKKMPGRTIAGGFGHMGCCHLFVIEQVSEVEARRTPVPDDEQNFSCTNSTWQSEYPWASVHSMADRVAANRQFLIDQVRAHGDDSLIESMESESRWDLLGITGYLVLSSPDLLTTYTAQFPQYLLHLREAKKPQSPAVAAPIIMNVTRERCVPSADQARNGPNGAEKDARSRL
jgi:hypothetical protein